MDLDSSDFKFPNTGEARTRLRFTLRPIEGNPTAFIQDIAGDRIEWHEPFEEDRRCVV